MEEKTTHAKRPRRSVKDEKGTERYMKERRRFVNFDMILEAIMDFPIKRIFEDINHFYPPLSGCWRRAGRFSSRVFNLRAKSSRLSRLWTGKKSSTKGRAA